MTTTARHLWWSTRTATAQIVRAFTTQRNTIFRTSPTVPEKVVISRVGSERARAAAPSRAGKSLRTAVVLSRSSLEEGSDPFRGQTPAFGSLAARDLVAAVLLGLRQRRARR